MVPYVGAELKTLVFSPLDIQTPSCAALHGILNPSFVVICWHFARERSNV